MAQNIAYQDLAGGKIHVYSVNQNLPRVERLKTALNELQHMGRVRIFLYKRRKLRVIKTVKHY